MRYSIILGAAALVAASPAPQAFDPNGLDAVATLTQGPPVGVGPAQETAYQPGAAQSQAAAAATATAIAQSAKRSINEKSLKARTFWWSWHSLKQISPAPAPVPSVTSTTSTSTVVPTTTSAPVVAAQTTKAPSTTDGVVPSSCTPVSWTNTYAFTSDSACPTAIEVGTYCGFINPDDPCAPQPAGKGVPPTDDTVNGFLNNDAYKQLAVGAQTPSGYMQSFVNLQGATTGNGYLSYKTLDSYDVATCSKFCDDSDTCTGFNIYIERDPKWNPHQCSCDNPPSTINYKCSIWGQKLTKDTATNTGSGRDSFQVVITGSNGYNKATYTPPTPPSCSRPQNCGKKLLNQAPYCMGQKTFPGPFDPSLCAAYAQAQNAINRKFGIIGAFLSLFGMNKGACIQFQAAYLEKAGLGFGTHCRLFTKKFTPDQATLDISVGGTSQWGCQQAFTWDVDVNASFTWGGWSRKN
ncbi:uncharacterized protein EKO05_0000155 [Ascochyta rabiei]|uniref:Uncharacterized protein n=1 Tax=Didymella rabiei TaxID=5454 RepID=A0A163CA71_DIDRA|nr:uncharacterized protein EKO05_0000155 [Ascochyta rabiei]KZM22316.1 hypothetical protein ST47_g6573 [Ascochyta rabiei]UPX09466.1 hypothetical protein EKO05_0000155 [Ascochyta rabiei]